MPDGSRERVIGAHGSIAVVEKGSRTWSPPRLQKEKDRNSPWIAVIEPQSLKKTVTLHEPQ
jgi:hypothetical protein